MQSVVARAPRGHFDHAEARKAHGRLPRLGALEDEIVESVPDLGVLANVGI
jgi:hypothetical protein